MVCELREIFSVDDIGKHMLSTQKGFEHMRTLETYVHVPVSIGVMKCS